MQARAGTYNIADKWLAKSAPVDKQASKITAGSKGIRIMN
jgi:hypothetical protein